MLSCRNGGSTVGYRGVGRMELFSKEKEYAALEGVLEETCESRPIRICAVCLMHNHWHLVLWPEHDGDLAAFMQRVRYVERNALRAGLVERAEAWRWCSLWRRTSGTPEQKQWLSDWPRAYIRRAEQLGLESTLRAPHTLTNPVLHPPSAKRFAERKADGNLGNPTEPHKS